MTKPSTRIRHMIDTDPTRAVARTLQEVATPSAEAKCCNPTCQEMCTWILAKHGPPPRFHSDKCRSLYARTRQALMQERDAYRQLIDEGAPTYDQRAELRRRAQTVQMQLDRYPRLDEPAATSGL